MNYEEQSRKDKPFEGLLLEEAKRLFVYMCYVAHPRLTPEDVEKRWGKVLPPEEIPTVFEAMEIAEQMKQTDNHIQQNSQVIVTPPTRGATAWKAVTWILVVLGVVVAIALGVSDEMRKAEIREAEIRKQKEMRMQEEMRKEEKLRQQKEQLIQETTELIKDATSLLSSTAASSKELWKMGFMLQALRKEVHSKDGILTTDNMVLLDELVLRCYKKARGNTPPFEDIVREAFQIDACYRISLLYLPNKYRHFVAKDDQVAALSENEEIAKEYLKEAADCDHYKALSLFCEICLDDYRECLHDKTGQLLALQSKVTTYRRQLANHKHATGADVYLFAKWISKIAPDESLMYLKKAAKMESTAAKKELLLNGITFDE